MRRHQGREGRSGGSQSGTAGDSLRPGHLPFRASDAVGTAADLLYVLSLIASLEFDVGLLLDPERGTMQ